MTMSDDAYVEHGFERFDMVAAMQRKGDLPLSVTVCASPCSEKLSPSSGPGSGLGDRLDAARAVVGRPVDQRADRIGGHSAGRVRRERNVLARGPGPVSVALQDDRHAAMDRRHRVVGGGGEDGAGLDGVAGTAPGERPSERSAFPNGGPSKTRRFADRFSPGTGPCWLILTSSPLSAGSKAAAPTTPISPSLGAATPSGPACRRAAAGPETRGATCGIRLRTPTLLDLATSLAIPAKAFAERPAKIGERKIRWIRQRVDEFGYGPVDRRLLSWKQEARALDPVVILVVEQEIT